MTKLQSIKQETEETVERLGYYIPPYRLAQMLKTAQQVIDLISKSTVPSASYAECRFILEIVQGSIEKANGMEESQ